LIEDGRFSFGMDTLQIARKGIRDDKTGVGVPTAYTLQTLFQFVSRTLSLTSHRAMADVKATATVFQFPIFWDTRTECIFRLSIWEEQQQQGGPIAIPAPPRQLDNDLVVPFANARTVPTAIMVPQVFLAWIHNANLAMKMEPCAP
jgi:hypothetical protein